MSANRYDLMTGRKDKDGKTFWQRVGVMFPAKSGEGFAIKLEAYPLPNEKGEVWLAAFVPHDKDGRLPSRGTSNTSRRVDEDPVDDIPF